MCALVGCFICSDLPNKRFMHVIPGRPNKCSANRGGHCSGAAAKQRKKVEQKEAKLRRQSVATCLVTTVAVSLGVGDSLVLTPWGPVAEMPSTKPPQHVKLRLLHICVGGTKFVQR